MKHLELNKDLIFKIREAGRYLHPRPADKNRQKEILVFLSENGTIPQRELTRRLKIKPPSVSELLRKLEDVDLIRRIPNEYDRRNMNVELTDLGLAVAEEYRKNSKDYEDELFSVLTPEEKDELIILLDKLLEYWEEILGPEPPRPEHRPPHERPGEPHRPPHEEPRKPHRPPHDFRGFPFGPFGEFPNKSKFNEAFKSFGKEPIGPENWENFFEMFSSFMENMPGRKGPFSHPDFDDFVGSDEPNISPDDYPVEEPIPPEDDELSSEPDLELNIEETEDEKS